MRHEMEGEANGTRNGTKGVNTLFINLQKPLSETFCLKFILFCGFGRQPTPYFSMILMKYFKVRK